MSQNQDLYAVLGVLPAAEPAVIVAAYRALASLYHPDRWQGDKDAAHKKMSEINAAYEVLGDVSKRREYDARQTAATGTFKAADEEADQAFDDALNELEDRWTVAISVFPDLVGIRKSLDKTAHRLAFAFVTYMLDSKKFDHRHEVAAQLKTAFLQRYFGSNPQVVAFAEELIDLGMKDAVKALNLYVDVLGLDTDPTTFLKKIEQDFDVPNARGRLFDAQLAQQKHQAELERLSGLKALVRSTRNPTYAKDLVETSGYEVNILGGGLFKPSVYQVVESASKREIASFESAGKFSAWVAETLC